MRRVCPQHPIDLIDEQGLCPEGHRPYDWQCPAKAIEATIT